MRSCTAAAGNRQAPRTRICRISQKLSQALPIYLLLMIGLSFMLLMLMFRSVLVTLKTALDFLLTTGPEWSPQPQPS